MTLYTRQADLGRFGARWGCFFTCLINICEKELGRRLTKLERAACIGIFFDHDKEYIAIANYKNHNCLGNEIPGWSETADPEWHFLVRDMHKALSILLSLFKMHLSGLTHIYEIQELKTRVGSHFVLLIDETELVNPDPSLVGYETISVRAV